MQFSCCSVAPCSLVADRLRREGYFAFRHPDPCPDACPHTGSDSRADACPDTGAYPRPDAGSYPCADPCSDAGAHPRPDTGTHSCPDTGSCTNRLSCGYQAPDQ